MPEDGAGRTDQPWHAGTPGIVTVAVAGPRIEVITGTVLHSDEPLVRMLDPGLGKTKTARPGGGRRDERPHADWTFSRTENRVR